MSPFTWFAPTHRGALPIRLRSSALLALALTLLPPPLHGQIASGIAEEPATELGRDDYWFGFALGGAGTRLTCDLCQVSRDLGPAAEFSVGSFARPDLRVGVEFGTWMHDDRGSRETIYRAGVVAHLRPDLDRGVHLTGGFGWLRYKAGQFRYDAPRVSLGAGWDYPFSSRYRIGNQVTLDATSFGSLRNGDTAVVRNVGISLVRVSIQLHRI